MAAQVYYSPFVPAFNSNGLPVPGATLTFFYTGTTTKAPIYADEALTTPLSNPVVADAAARFPDIYLSDAYTYRVRLLDATGAPLGDDIDPYVPGQALKGNPGANVMAIGTIDEAAGLTIPETTDLVQVSGAAASGDFGAGITLKYDPTVDADYVAAAPRRSFLDATGRGFRQVVQLPDVQPQVQNLWARLRAEEANVAILYVGDSTGDANSEHVYQRAQWFAALLPTHTVIYRVWVDGSNAWSATTQISTGTGLRTLYVDNLSVPGSSGYYLEGARASSIFDGRREYSLVITNYGHNYGSTVPEVNQIASIICQIANLQERCPRAGILITLQNPRKDYPQQTAGMVANLARAALMTGSGIVDVYHEFTNHPDYGIAPGAAGSLYLDDTHPNDFGQKAWRIAEDRVLREPDSFTLQGTQMPSPFFYAPPNFAPNPLFWDWPSGQAAPTGWTFTNCTASKDAGRVASGPYSLRATPTGTNPSISANVSNALSRLRGKYATLVVKCWRPSNMDLLAGRCSIAAGNGSVDTSDTAAGRNPGESVDGWYYSMATLLVPQDSTSLSLLIYTGAASGADTGKGFSIDQVVLCEGVLPGAANPLGQPNAVLDQLYDEANVGIPSIPSGLTGTLTVAGSTITLTGVTGGGQSRVYINLPGTISGMRYRASWTHVSDVPGNGGTVIVRNGLNGTGTQVGPTVAWNLGPMEFTAPAGPCCLMLSGNGATTSYQQSNWSVVPLFSGLAPAAVSLANARNADGTAIDATGGAGKFKIVSTPGTAQYLEGESAQNNTKTDTAYWEVTLPDDYIAGRQLTVTVNALITGTGTAGTKTLDVKAYALAADGTSGTDLGPATQALTTSAASYSFYVAGTGLAPGGRVLIGIEAVLQETANVNPIKARINSVVLS